ncbi:hypothetical protein AHAS_Ahas19G0193900 [Arachis hypogaea]
MKGGITRAKEHLMIKSGNVAGCKKILKDKRNRGRQSATLRRTEEQSANARELDLESLGFRLLEEDAQGIDEPHNPAPMAVARGGASRL